VFFEIVGLFAARIGRQPHEPIRNALSVCLGLARAQQGEARQAFTRGSVACAEAGNKATFEIEIPTREELR
jgi:hypothetical protein